MVAASEIVIITVGAGGLLDVLAWSFVGARQVGSDADPFPDGCSLGCREVR